MWFKVDDRLAVHPKTMAAGNAAMGLWVRAGAWSCMSLTDGDIPAAAVTACGGTKKDAQQLVDAGLWDATDTGYKFHDWHEYQPTRVEVEAERAAAKDRMRRARTRN